MKQILLIVLLIGLVGAAILAWMVLGSATAFDEKRKSLYISSKAATKEAVLDSLRKNNILKSEGIFNFLAGRLGYWDAVKPGKYDIKKGSSALSIVRMLRNGQQSPVNLVITKLRTKADFARLTGNKFEFDSSSMSTLLSSADLMNDYNKTPDLAMTAILPDTYSFLWTTSPESVYKKLAEEEKKFWTEERKQKADEMGFTPEQVYTIASIVDEESNALAEKGNIASVYINRVKKGMPLQADPTIRFALNDFTIKRIYGDHLNVASPYNTYRNTGLPPGPICTPSKKTIDAVLNAPTTNYLYFVADSSFNGRHSFSASYEEHMKKARAYQEAFKRRFAAK